MLKNARKIAIIMILLISLNTTTYSEGLDMKNAKLTSDNISDEKSLISRAEFIKMIVNILEVENKIGAVEVNFEDVSKDDWYYPYVQIAYNANIIQGDGRNFNPHNNITRQEMATIISRALRLEKIDKLESNLKDLDKVSPWAREHVNKCINHKLLIGNDQRLFLPKDFATKEMATVTTMRAYEKINKNKQEILEKSLKQK